MIRISVDGKEIGTLQFDEKVVKIDAWYDRHTRDWCIQKLNSEGYQVGDSIRVGDKVSKDAMVKELIEEFGLK